MAESCIRCGVRFSELGMKPHHKRRYCAPCRKANDLEKKREWYSRRPRRVSRCSDCEKLIYTVAVSKGANPPKRCRPCAAAWSALRMKQRNDARPRKWSADTTCRFEPCQNLVDPRGSGAGRGKYCCDQHRDAGRKKYHRQWKQALAQERRERYKPTILKCSHCGSPFEWDAYTTPGKPGYCPEPRPCRRIAARRRTRSAETTTQPCLIYMLVTERTGHLKIGRANDEDNVRARWKACQTGNHEQVRLVGWFSGTHADELEAHDEAELLTQRTSGEWFRFSGWVWDRMWERLERRGVVADPELSRNRTPARWSGGPDRVVFNQSTGQYSITYAS